MTNIRNDSKCRFVGYLEEQAVITYSDILQKMDSGHLPMWRWVNQLINTKKKKASPTLTLTSSKILTLAFTLRESLTCLSFKEHIGSSLPAPEIAVTYWKLSDKALMRDVILAIR